MVTRANINAYWFQYRDFYKRLKVLHFTSFIVVLPHAVVMVEEVTAVTKPITAGLNCLSRA